MLQNVGTDGTIYAELALDDPKSSRPPVVRKQEEATEYAELDYNKLKMS